MVFVKSAIEKVYYKPAINSSTFSGRPRFPRCVSCQHNFKGEGVSRLLLVTTRRVISVPSGGNMHCFVRISLCKLLLEYRARGSAAGLQDLVSAAGDLLASRFSRHTEEQISVSPPSERARPQSEIRPNVRGLVGKRDIVSYVASSC